MSLLKLSFRNLAKTPFVTVVAILSLALGIGANAAIFSLFDQILLRPLPVQEPGRLVNLSAPGPKPGSQSCNQAGDCDAVFSYEMFRDLQKAPGRSAGFSGLAGHRSFGANLSTGDKTLSGRGELVSGSYFPVLGLKPALGRLISPADDGALGQHSVVVVSHRFWTRELGADPKIVGKSLIVNGRSLEVLGVTPEGFEGTTLGTRPDVYAPLSMRSTLESYFDAKNFENRRNYWVYVFGRLAPGVTMERAGTQLNVTYHSIVNDVEASLQEGMSDETLKRFRTKKLLFEDGRRGQSSIHGESRTPLTLLLAVTGVVLIIACANIANLLLARGAARAQEMAIRSSLGAGRHRLLTQLLTESALLAVLGGAAGLLVARWTLVFIGSLLPADSLSDIQLALSPQMVLFAAVLALATGLLFGLYPALHATRPDLVTALKGAAGQPSGARSAARFRNGLVTAQIALSMALLIAAGLFIKSLVNVSRVDLGLDEDNLVTFAISPALNGYSSDQSMALFGRTEEELAALPGVVHVSDSMVPLLGGDSWGNSVRVQGFDAGPDTDTGSRYNEVGADYFRTMGVTLLAGREFTATDTKDAPKVAIVNQAFAEKFHLNGREAVGKWMGDGLGDKLDIQIVGLAADAKYNSVKDKIPPLYFRPFRQGNRLGFLNFYLRTKGDPSTVMQAVPAVIKRLDPNLPVENLATVRQVARENVFLDRLITTLAAAFAILATLLAAVGLYGVLAYSVAQRTREIGLRMALGAGGENVRRMVLRQMARMFVIGGVLGLAGALVLGRAARSLLYELGGHDPVVLASGVAVLAVVALTAAYLPARRASQVDPMTALRHE